MRTPLRWSRLGGWMLRVACRPARGAEIQADLAERVEEMRRNGVAPGAVGRWYLRNVVSLMWHYRIARAWPRGAPPAPGPRPTHAGWRTLGGDLRHAMRALVHRPMFAAVVIGTLGLGIGANVAVFTIARNVVLRPPPYPDPDRLVSLWMEFRRDPAVPGFEIVASEPEYLEFRAATTSFAGIAGYWTGRANLMGTDEPFRVRTASVSSDFLQILGIAPAHGRGFQPGEDGPDAPPIVILTDGLWARAFGRDTSVLGSSILLNGQQVEVVGILPASFRFPGSSVDLLRLNMIDPANLAGRSSHYLRLLGRLKPGVSVSEAQAEAAVVAAQMDDAQPGLHGVSRSHPMRLASLQDRTTGPVRPTLWLLGGASLLVLLIACANVANLMFARSEGRTRELAIRGALGASRERLLRLLFAESLLLCLAGAATAVVLSTMGLPALVAAGGTPLLSTEPWHLDGPIVAFALGLATLTAVGFSVAPLTGRRAGRRRMASLRDGGRGGVDRGRSRVRNGLLLTQLGVAVVLLIGAGVLLRNLAALLRVDPGFDPAGVVVMTFSLDASRYPDVASVTEFHRRLDERLTALPIVTGGGAIRTLPLTSDGGLETLFASGTRAAPEEGINAVYQVASPGYFGALSIPVREGRGIEPTDLAVSEPVAVVNQTMADRFWPDGDAIGQAFRLGPAGGGNANPLLTIVGVVGDVMQADLGRSPSPQFFVPRSQAGAIYGGMATREATLVVRGSAAPPILIDAVRGVLRDLDPLVPPSDIRTMQDVVDGAVTSERFVSLLLGMFAVVALCLAGIGVYGLMAYLVAQRTRDIGVRMALGADRGRLVASVVGRAVGLALAGAGLGLVGAFAGGRVLDRFVSVVPVHDPVVYGVGPVILVLTAALAAFAPARRAAAVDPTVALRAD